MLMYILLTLLIILVIVLLWNSRKFIHLSKTFPHDLPNVPLLGIVPMFFGSTEDIMSSIDKIGRETNRKGGIITFWMAHQFFVGITDPALIKFVLNNCLEKHDLMVETFSFTLKLTSLVAPVSMWRHKRKHVQVLFKHHNLSLMSDVFAEQSNKLIEILHTKTGETISIYEYLSKYISEALCENLLSIKMDIQKGNEKTSLIKDLLDVTRMTAERFFKPWLLIRPLYKLLPKYKVLMRLMKNSHELTQQLLENARKTTKKNNDEKTGEQRISLVEHLVTSTNYSDEEIKNEALLVLSAGLDTSAGALGFACLLLAKHPDVQQKICQEVIEVIGVENRPITTQDYVDLKYLDAVVKESLRLLPPLPLIARSTDKETTLPNGVVLPKGAGIAIIVWGANRNPSYWGDDADLFRPERFLEADLQHISFSYGPRNCVGYKYAMMSMKCALVALLPRFRILPSPNTTEPLRLAFEITLKHVEQYQVILEPRDKIVA